MTMCTARYWTTVASVVSGVWWSEWSAVMLVLYVLYTCTGDFQI
jgi:hypothetical protein